jgi:hypothetical protein
VAAVAGAEVVVGDLRDPENRRRALDGDAADRPLDDPWSGIVDTTAARRELGWRPTYPSVYTARDAGAL